MQVVERGVVEQEAFRPNANTLNATYTPTAAEILNGNPNPNFNYYWQMETVSQLVMMLKLTFTPAPTANAGTDVTVCANNPEVNLNGQVTVATGGIWTWWKWSL